MPGGDDDHTTTATAGDGAPWPVRLRLPELDVDPARLAAEALALPPHAWIPHFHVAIYTGDWSGVPLRSDGGAAGSLYPTMPGAALERHWLPTPWLDACPATAAVIAQLPFPTTSVRFLRLGPGSEIRPHNDPGLGAPHGEARLHLALVTDEGVSFAVAGVPVDLRPGEWWYLDLDQEHTAANRGSVPRIHLVVDAIVDEALGARLRGGEPVRP